MDHLGYLQDFYRNPQRIGSYLCKTWQAIHIKCKTTPMLSEEGKQSLPEFLVSANYSNPNVDAQNLSFKSDKNKSN